MQDEPSMIFMKYVNLTSGLNPPYKKTNVRYNAGWIKQSESTFFVHKKPGMTSVLYYVFVNANIVQYMRLSIITTRRALS